MTRNAKIILGLSAAVVIAAALALILLIPSQDTDEHRPKEPMRIATYFWPGMYWIDVARSKGWFEDAGLDVTFVDANADYYGALAGVREGRIDTLAVWLFDMMRMSQSDVRLVMVLATDESRGSESLVSSPTIQTVEQLKGKRIGVPKETTLAYVLEVILARFGMNFKDVTLVDMKAEKAADQLASGEVDAVITWEPYATAAAEQGHRLYDTAKISGLIRAGMIFRQSFIKERPEDIKRMLEVWLRATKFIRSHSQEAFAIVAQAQNVSPEEVESFAQLNRILGLRDNVGAFTYASGLESLFGSARKIQRFLIKRGGEEASVRNPEDMLEGRFIRELAREKRAP